MDDILDIDELTKDDSFFSLDDKDHDVCNIIQQWKNKQQFQTQQQQQTQNNDKAYRVNSRTFTRPKRKSAAQNLESQFNGITEQQPQSPCQQSSLNFTLDTTTATTKNNVPMLNVQIGGRIRTPLNARSMLHDTSPPSYMDASLDSSPMDNSLVTSADFSNIDFLLSTPSFDHKFNNGNGNGGSAHYTLSDMIRDRKALESLTLSGDDGTLIKDSQIAQFDDISLALCKASSGSSTMGNSTESVEGNSSSGYGYSNGNGTMVLTGNDDGSGNTTFGFNERTMREAMSGLSNTFTSGNGNSNSNSNVNAGNSVLQQTMVLSKDEEIISETTFSLIENGQSFVIEREEPEVELAKVNAKATPQMNETHNVETVASGDQLSETFCMLSSNKTQEQAIPNANADRTYECELPLNSLGTPEEFRRPMHPISTPHHANFNNGVNTFSLNVNMIREDVNISPIVYNEALLVSAGKPEVAAAAATSSRLQTTFDKTNCGVVNTCSGSPISHLNDNYDELEMLENIEMPHSNELKAKATPVHRRRSRTRLLNMEYELAEQQQHQRTQSPQQLQEQLDLEQMRLNKSTIEMQDVMDLAEAEAELLAAADEAGLSNEDDEKHFEHMLDELGRIELNAEQLKMKKSVETIKKRFNCTLNGSGGSNGDAHLLESASSKTFTSETREEALRQLRDEMSRNNENSWQQSSNSNSSTKEPNNSFISSTASNVSMAASSGGGSSGGERLLSRRSRLYDDINLSTLAGVATAAELAASSTIAPVVQTEQTTASTDDLCEKTESAESGVEAHNAAKYRLQEKRERDRDRFKTIKIVKNPNNDFGGAGGVDGAGQNELKVPCIDDDDDGDVDNVAEEIQNATQQRASRRDYAKIDALSEAAVAATNKLQANTNFLTYKKPKESRITTKLNRPAEIINDNLSLMPKPSLSSKLNGEVRSLSRPRYLSGLQKCSVVSKAASADDLESPDYINNLVGAVNPSDEGKTSQLPRLFGQLKKPGDGNGARTANAAANAATAHKSELKSPLGLKAKSLHNLSSNLNYTAYSTGIATRTSRLGSYGLRKINSGGINSATEQQRQQSQQQQQQVAQPKTTLNSMRTQKPATSANSFQSQNSQAVFKKPQRVTGPSRPATTTTKTTSGAATGARSTAANIARPSSGYYSLNAVPKAESVTQHFDDCKPSQNKTLANNGKSANGLTNANAADEPQQLTRITVGASGIPKPSGLRPPTKRSGLPLSSTGVRR